MANLEVLALDTATPQIRAPGVGDGYSVPRDMTLSAGTTLTAPTVNATTVDATNVEVTNVKAKDGTASIAIANSTGVATLTANPVLNAGTANGVAYLNASKVVTSGSALTFDGTRMAIGTTPSATDTLLVYGSSAAAIFNVVGDGQNSNLNASRYSTDTSSSFGIFYKARGTYASPAAVSTGDAAGQISFQAYGGSNFRDIARISAVVETYTSDTNVSGYLSFRTNSGSTGSSEKMRLTAAGDLGIGTASPGSKLEVNGISNLGGTAASVRVSVGTFAAGIGSIWTAGSGNSLHLGTTDASTDINFYANNTERFRIESSGNIRAGAAVALATTATDGFLYVPTCAGTPTGTPTAITGMAPIVVNTTNNKLYFYSGGAWRDAGP